MLRPSEVPTHRVAGTRTRLPVRLTGPHQTADVGMPG